MKATHGLVPYTGVMPIEATIDHAGPMTATVGDNALLLEVIAELMDLIRACTTCKSRNTATPPGLAAGSPACGSG